MNPSSLPASAGLPRFVNRCLIAAFLVLGVLGPLGTPAARATDGNQAAINETKQQIASVKPELDAARTELRQLLASKPAPPAQGATAVDQKAYGKTLAAWQQKVDALQARIASLQNPLKALEQRLRTLGGQKTESSTPPAT